MNRRILVIDDDAVTRKTLATFLQHRGYQVFTAENGAEGLNLFRDKRPPIAFCDLRMPRMGGLDFLRAARLTDPHVQVIIVTAFGDLEVALQAFRLGAVNFFMKPINFQEVTEALMALESRTIAEHGTRFDFSFLQNETMVLEIPNDLNVVSAVVNHITSTLPHFFDDQTVHGIQGALIEMIVNAIEHGNLGISYEEKTRALDDDRLNELIQAKSQQPQYANRRVRTLYHMAPDKVTYVIEDEGQGFNIKELPDPSEPENLWKGHGRGILMTRALMDEVSYNEKGNQVTLVKRLPTLEVLEADEEEGKT